MEKKYKIIKNFAQANSETSYFGKYDKEGETIINSGKLFPQTITYSKRLFYSEDYISHTAFINIKRISNKLKFRFSIHSNYDGIGESYFEDCQVNLEKYFLKLRGFFSTPSGIIQLKETLEFVLENNDNLELKAKKEELEEFKLIVEALGEEIEKFNKTEPEFYQGIDREQLIISQAKNKNIKKGIIYFSKERLIYKPKFKTFEDLIDFVKSKEEQGEVKKSIFYFNELDIESNLFKKLLNLNNVSIYIKEFEREYSYSYEIEIIISKEENGYKNKIDDKSCTFCGVVNEKKVTVISNFPYMYNKEKREESKKNGFEKSKKTFEKIEKELLS